MHIFSSNPVGAIRVGRRVPDLVVSAVIAIVATRVWVGGASAFADNPPASTAARPVFLSNEEWNLNTNNLCFIGPGSEVFHLVGQKESIKTSFSKMDDVLGKLVTQGSGWVKIANTYINLNQVSIAQWNEGRSEVVVSFSDGTRLTNILKGDDAKTLMEAVAKFRGG